MPYITKSKREEIDIALDMLHMKLQSLEDDETNNMEGNLNYVITKLLADVYTTETPAGRRVKNYRDANAVMGLLESVKTEFYRKFVAAYEDQKEFENGAV